MKPNLERLTYLARKVLPYVDDKKWDMGTWFYHGSDTHVLKTPTLHDCGTSACALGHMALSRKGIRDGWTWIGDFPEFGGKLEIEAAVKYFGISTSEALSLFSPNAYDCFSSLVTPLMVAEHVEGIIGFYS